MVRRHPALSVVASAYGVGIVVFALVPWRGYEDGSGLARAIGMPNAGELVDALTNLLLFLPFGVLVALLTRPRRRMAAVVVVALAACWVELAQMVWVPSRSPSMGCLIAQCVGGAIGIAVVVLATRRAAPTQERSRLDLETPIESTVPRS